MKTKHIFVSALDVGEILPFSIQRKGTFQGDVEEADRSRKELITFIDLLEKNYGISIYYMGMDVIETKNYERFIFEDQGFFEIMTESPLAMSAHFVNEEKAKKFCEVLKETLKAILPDHFVSELFIKSIEVHSEEDESLTYEKWDRVKEISHR